MFKLVELGETCCLVRLEKAASFQELYQLTLLLLNSRPPFVRDIVPTQSSIAIHFDPLANVGQHTGPLEQVRAWLLASIPHRLPQRANFREHCISVVYGGVSGPDLTEIAQQLGMSESAVVGLHCRAVYEVAMTGYKPGFAYLVGLSSPLCIPRRRVPRVKVPRGSVALGGGYTGVYPDDLPGGWHILGNAKETLFDALRERPSLFETGDIVRFYPAEQGVQP